jgi:hypothetical protein
MSLNVSMRESVSMCVCMSVYLYTWVCVCLSVCVSLSVCVCLSVYVLNISSYMHVWLTIEWRVLSGGRDCAGGRASQRPRGRAAGDGPASAGPLYRL